MVRYLLLTSCFLLCSVFAIGQTALGGKVTEAESGDPVIFGNIALYKNGVLITGSETDFDGVYSFTGIDPGTYDVEVSYVGFPTKRITGVQIFADKANTVNVALDAGIDLETVVVIGYEVPLVEQDNTTQGKTLTSAEIRRRPVRSVNALAATAAGVSSSDEGAALSIRGSRSNATNYYLDGIRISGRAIPQQDIDQLQVITGGVPALYGDVTGGIISLTSKGPSSKFSGGLEVESSQFLDSFDSNLFAANLSGPLIKRKSDGKSILGFRLSGQYLSRLDDDPPALSRPVATDEAVARFEENPLTVFNAGAAAGLSTVTPTASFITPDDVEFLDFNPNEERTNLDLTGKLDLRISDAIDVTFTGTYNDEEDKFTPNQANLNNLSWQLLNNRNNPTDEDRRYRGNFRFRHRIGAGNLEGEGASAEGSKAALIQNATYSIQAGYERQNEERGDPRHGDNFLDYGYIGKFNLPFSSTVFLEEVLDSNGVVVGEQAVQGDFSRTGVFNDENNPYFQPGGVNPVLENYIIPELIGFGSPQQFVINGRIPNVVSSVHNFYSNVGSVFNNYFKSRRDLITANINGSFELVPGGGGRHNIQFGFLYEQRDERTYSINPVGLWTLAEQLSNNRIQGNGLDSLNQTGTLEIQGVFNPDSTHVIPQFANVVDNADGSRFYEDIRNQLGVPLHEYVNIYGLTPGDIRLDMFTPFELFQNDLVSYRGYDYLGNIVDNVSFEDFFNEEGPDGIRTFPIGGYEPNYAAFFVQDKFQYKDIIFRLGVRVDRFDANTKVLKDPFSLYEIQGASQFFAGNPNTSSQRPGNIGDDFKVYLESSGTDVVKGYRDGETWFFADGTQANNGQEVLGTTDPAPALVNPDADITDQGYDVDNSFDDYKPQINVMPRLAFSFPISDAANFFAHYDILVQRPPSNNIVTPLRYFQWFQTGLRNNANLRPEKTVDYEVGFQQKISNSSAVKIAAYYKELRDMIQARFFFQVAGGLPDYETYDNLDFGTVKGFSLQYDLRRTGNVSLNIAYTLQFADGTGSDANSSRNTGSRSIQRVLFPLSFDERHRINMNLDYRYGSGKQYNGPRIGGNDIFANAGVNLQFTAVSGRPFTRNRNINNTFGGAEVVGSINGSRLPWTQLLNLRVDKSFALTKAESGKRPLNMNVWFRVSNLFDQRNIINVFSVTGEPDDDGFLSSSRGIETLASQPDALRDSYLLTYQYRVANPNNFSLPRRMFVGLKAQRRTSYKNSN